MIGFARHNSIEYYFGLNVSKSNGRITVDLRRMGAKGMKRYFQLISVFRNRRNVFEIVNY